MLVPWGGGGLTVGIASALAAVAPATRVVACEPETGAPLAASLAAGEPHDRRLPAVVRRRGRLEGAPARDVGARAAARRRAVAVPLPDVAEAVRLLATRARVVAEGAGALALAAALAGHGGDGRVVCIVSGGNIDPERLAAILPGRRALVVLRARPGGALASPAVRLVALCTSSSQRS